MRPAGSRARIDGASAVTFVMALPLLMGLLCAVADIGRAAYLGMEADVAAQAACRYAAQRVAQGDKGPDGASALSAARASSAFTAPPPRTAIIRPPVRSPWRFRN